MPVNETQRAAVLVSAAPNQLTQNTITAYYRDEGTTLLNYDGTQRASSNANSPMIIGDYLDIVASQHHIGADHRLTSYAYGGISGWGAIGLPLLNSGFAYAKWEADGGAGLTSYGGAVSDSIIIAWWENVPAATTLAVLDVMWYIDQSASAGDQIPSYDVTFGEGMPNWLKMTKIAETLYCDFPHDGRRVNIRHAKFVCFDPPTGARAVYVMTTIPSSAETQLLQGKCTFYSRAAGIGQAVTATGISDLASVTVPLQDSRARVQCSIAAPNGVLLQNPSQHKRFEYTNAPEPAGVNFPMLLLDRVAYPPSTTLRANLSPGFYWSATALPIYADPAELPAVPIIFDNVWEGTDGTNAGSWQWQYEAARGAYVLVVTGSYNGYFPDGGTFDNKPLERIAVNGASNRAGLSFWGIADAPGGAKTINMHRSPGDQMVCTAISFTGARRAVAGQSGGLWTGQPSMTETCEDGDKIMQAFGFCYVPPGDRPIPTVTGGQQRFSRMGIQYAGLTINQSALSPTTFTIPGYANAYGINGLTILLKQK